MPGSKWPASTTVESYGGTDGGTAWFAHIGGFLTGMLLVTVMGTRNRYVRRQENVW